MALEVSLGPQIEEVFTVGKPELDALLRQAMERVNAGDLSQGRSLLEKVLEQDPHNDKAWVWLSACVDDPHQRRICLQQALRANPQNQAALDGMKVLDGELFQASAPEPSLIDSRLAAIGMAGDEPAAVGGDPFQPSNTFEPAFEIIPATVEPPKERPRRPVRLYLLIFLVLVLGIAACWLAAFYVILPQLGFFL